VLAQPELGAPEVKAEVETLSPARADNQNALPEYPPAALAAPCPDAVVAVRVTVTTEGRATLFREVPGRPVSTDACHAAFWTATLAAMRDWRFMPATREVLHESLDVDGDGKPDYTWLVPEPVAIYLDFEFTFRIVEGQGRVDSR
jgi:hypothetical protein